MYYDDMPIMHGQKKRHHFSRAEENIKFKMCSSEVVANSQPVFILYLQQGNNRKTRHLDSRLRGRVAVLTRCIFRGDGQTLMMMLKCLLVLLLLGGVCMIALLVGRSVSGCR